MKAAVRSSRDALAKSENASPSRRLVGVFVPARATTSPEKTCTSAAPEAGTSTANRVPRSIASPEGVTTVNPFACGGTSAAMRPFVIRSRCGDSKRKVAGASMTICAPRRVSSSSTPAASSYVSPRTALPASRPAVPMPTVTVA